MEVDNLAATLGSNGVFRERLDSMRTLVENCVNAVRNMSLLLRPSMLDDLGLVAALETPVGGEEDSQLGDFIADKAVVSPSDEVINLKLKEQTASVLRTLTPREEKIIKMRFGLEDSRQHTLEEVGQSFGLTRERIRQNEAQAFRKLPHPSCSRKLRVFLEPPSRN